MELSCRITHEGTLLGGVDSIPYIAVGKALECIPRTLCENCGADVIRVMTSLRVWIKNEEGKRSRPSMPRVRMYP